MVILNPFSGRWAALKRRAEVTGALDAAGVDYQLELTKGAGHAAGLARQAVSEGYTPIIAAGGDGLINEVVNGLAPVHAGQEAPWMPLGILPLGTANDLVDNLGMPRDLGAAARVIAAGQTRSLDLGWVNGHYFVNNAGLGLESYIAVIQNRMTRLRGMLRYLSATFTGIAHNPRWEMQLVWDDGEYRGPVTMISIGNCARTGGLFYTVPHADPFDGRLTFVYGFVPTRLELMRLLPMTMRPAAGNYVEHPEVHEVHARSLTVRTQPATPMHADGEVIAEQVQELEYRIVPGKLPLLM